MPYNPDAFKIRYEDMKSHCERHGRRLSTPQEVAEAWASRLQITPEEEKQRSEEWLRTLIKADKRDATQDE